MRESCDWNVDYIHQSIRSLAWAYSPEGMLYADAVCCLLFTYDLDDEAIAMYKKASVYSMNLNNSISQTHRQETVSIQTWPAYY